MRITRTYKFRLYPNEEQKVLINKTIGCTRFLYNKMLDYKKKNRSLSKFDMMREISKLYIDYPFLKEVDSMSLRSAVANLSDAFERYRKHQCEMPKYKKYGTTTSYRTNFVTSSYKGKVYENISIDLKSHTIKLPKLKEVKIRGYRKLENLNARIINATINKEVNKYYVSLCVEEEIEETENKEILAVGIDMGVRSLVTTSDGETLGNTVNIKKYEKKIKGLSKSLSRKKRGSNNYKKAKEKLGRVYQKLGNARKKMIEEVIAKLTKENDIIIAEKLKVKEMIEKKENRKGLRKNIVNATFGEFLRKLEYTCKWKNKVYYQVNTYYPSSQLCSVCGEQDRSMKELNKREYKCKKCGNKLDRDINASINILLEGIYRINKERYNESK